MVQLNKLGEQLGGIAGVTAMTDVTGFGIAGHLIEMAEGCGLSAELVYAQLPIIDGAKEYLAQRIVPDATYRNWNGYGKKIHFEAGVDVMEAFSLLPDPQTNGGLLVAVNPGAVDEVTQLFASNGFGACCTPIGQFIPKAEKAIIVR
jgi:selenide,water dikinase